MPDRKKVIKGFKLCLKTIDEPDCRKECPYYEACQKYEGRVIFQPLMRDALALLKEQPEIIRCKDCKHGKQLFQDYVSCQISEENESGCLASHKPDWFCADGKRKEDR